MLYQSKKRSYKVFFPGDLVIAKRDINCIVMTVKSINGCMVIVAHPDWDTCGYADWEIESIYE